ncbi:hypothetical protein FRC11_001499, partial [Ceratobasidium sp. 423]
MSGQNPRGRKTGQTIKRAGARYAQSLQKYAATPAQHDEPTPAIFQASCTAAPPESQGQEGESGGESTARKRKRVIKSPAPIGEVQLGPSNQATKPLAPVVSSTSHDPRPPAVLQTPQEQGGTSSKTSAQIRAMQAIHTAGTTCQQVTGEDQDMEDGQDISSSDKYNKTEKGKEKESVGDMMRKIEEIHNDEGGKVAVEALITLLQK